MNFAEIRRRYGSLAAYHTLGYKLAQRCLVLDITHLMVLDTSAVLSGNEIQATFRPLDFGEVVAFARSTESELDFSVARRLCDNLDYCFAALVDGQLAGYCWLALDSIEAIQNRGDSDATGVALSFPEDVIFLYKALVNPRYRGQGVYTAMVRAAAQWAREEQGIRHLVSTADWTNYAALRSCRRQGLRSLGRIWRIGVPGCMFTFGPSKAAQYGICFGDDARVTRRYSPSVDVIRQENAIGVSVLT